MNLEQAHTLSQLSLPKVQPKEKVQSAKKVAFGILARCEKGGYPYEHFPVNNKGAHDWAHKFLTSKDFVLMRINLNAAASAHDPRDPKRVKFYIRQIAANAESVKTWDPLVVDINKLKSGRTHLGYIPDVIFVDGKHRRKAMLACGIRSHWAWVGTKALKKMKAKDLKAADSSSDTEIYLPPVDGTKIASQYEMMAATVPALNIPTVRQDTGSGGSRPHDQNHPEMNAKKKKVHAQDCNACGAVSTGSLEPAAASDEKVPPDQSDAGSDVSASDQRKFNSNKPNVYPGGLKPSNVQQFGLNKEAAYQNNIGPRIVNKGASKSELSRELNAKGKVKAAIRVPKMWTKDKKKKMEAVAPPGRESQVKALKKKVGVPGAYKIAWSQENKGGK
jgi:hypothetical protein